VDAFKGTIDAQGKEIPFSFKNGFLAMQLSKEDFFTLFGAGICSMKEEEKEELSFMSFSEEDGQLVCDIDMEAFEVSIKEEND
tara:strand:- start:14 stop:262 length:249 start_codon:yes stop_codon:yes gene_type:complete